MTTFLRFGCPALIAGSIVALTPAAHGQEKSTFPEFTGKRVYVLGVPDRYQDLNAHISRLEKSSSQTYYVVVTSTFKPYRSIVDYSDRLFEFWERQTARTGRSPDPKRSVLVVAALDDHKVGVRVGSILRDRLGLNAETVESELIGKAFIGLASQGKYPDAIASLLDATNSWIVAQETGSGQATKASSKAQATTGQPPARAREKSATSPGVPTLPQQSTIKIDDQPPPRNSSLLWTPAMFVLIAGLAVLAAILAWLWMNHRRARLHLAGQIKEIKSKAVDVMDRLDSLKERLKLMPTSPEFREPMTGETQVLYHSANEKTRKLWDGWLEVMEALDKAQKLAGISGSMFSRKTLNDAQKLIDQQGSFEEIDRQAAAIAASVSQLDQAHQNARKVLDALTETRPKLDAGSAALAKLDLPTTPYQEDLDSLAADISKASSVLVADPVGTRKVLEQIQSRSEALLKRIQDVGEICVNSRQVKTALESLKRQVATHRSQGLKLLEQGGNPDLPLDQGSEACSETLTALRAGDPVAAAVKLDSSRSLLAEGQATIEKVQKAKAFCERDQPARLRETDRLRAALPQAESYHRDLDRDFARVSWQAVARNLEQANALLATFDRQAQDAAALSTTTRQEYLKGAALLEELARQQKITLRLMSGLGEQLNSLLDVRNECHKVNDEIEASERQAERYIRQNEAIVSDLARDSLAAAQQARQEIVAASNQPRPDWPGLRKRLGEAAEELSIAQSQAQDDVKNYEALTSEFNQVRQTASRVYAFLARHTEDRVAANEHYRTAADTLDRVGLALKEPHGAAAALLQQVRDAAADLDKSEQLAREDIRLAAQAQSMISEGYQSLQQAQGYAGMGIGADTSSAEYQLVEAQNLLQGQNYEQSIHCAGAAIQTARQVYYAAIQQAMLQQMAIAAEERRRAARMAAPAWDGISFGAAAAASAATAILSDAAADAAEPSSSEPATAAGSWSSDVGQGSW